MCCSSSIFRRASSMKSPRARSLRSQNFRTKLWRSSDRSFSTRRAMKAMLNRRTRITSMCRTRRLLLSKRKLIRSTTTHEARTKTRSWLRPSSTPIHRTPVRVMPHDHSYLKSKRSCQITTRRQSHRLQTHLNTRACMKWRRMSPSSWPIIDRSSASRTRWSMLWRTNDIVSNLMRIINVDGSEVSHSVLAYVHFTLSMKE